MYEATWAFHMTLADTYGNPVLAKLVRILYEMIHENQLRLYWRYVDVQAELESHRQLYQAICEGESKANKEMREHIHRVADIIEQAVESGARLQGSPQR
jgi:DNA-binding FadR family transcriptional regulator